MAISSIMENCSGLAVREGFERIIRLHLPNQKLLGDRNYYTRDTRERVNSENPQTLRKYQMQEYIAASVIVHSADGWNYLSRSIESLLNGDIASAIHFAYYAELRSAMSLMAFEGVGLFDRKHIWYNAAKEPTLFRGYTTHAGADSGLEAWANLTTKKDVLFKLIKVNNHTLEDWIRETGFSTNSKYVDSIITGWLKKWSIDLHLKKDQSIRNIMSYRPHFSLKTVDLEQAIEMLSEIWNLLEPNSSGGFPVLDRYLLRIVLEEVFKKSRGTAPVGTQYRSYMENVFGRIGEDPSSQLFSFLIRETAPSDALLFIEAKKDSFREQVNFDDPFPLICRAILLLRLSTGSASNLITESTMSRDDLRFWWESLCYAKGLSTTPPTGMEPSDLFTDIRDSLDDLEGYPSGSFNNIKQGSDLISPQLFYLKQFQRPSIWGLGI